MSSDKKPDRNYFVVIIMVIVALLSITVTVGVTTYTQTKATPDESVGDGGRAIKGINEYAFIEAERLCLQNAKAEVERPQDLYVDSRSTKKKWDGRLRIFVKEVEYAGDRMWTCSVKIDGAQVVVKSISKVGADSLGWW